jgi:hypothetical protein
MYTGLHASTSYCHILINLGFSRRIFEIYSNTKFNENPSSGNQDAPCGRRNVTHLMQARLKKLCRSLNNTRNRNSEDSAIKLASIQTGMSAKDCERY